MFEIISSDFSNKKKKKKWEVDEEEILRLLSILFFPVPLTHVKDAWTMIININFKYVLDKHMPSFIFIHCYCPMSAKC